MLHCGACGKFLSTIGAAACTLCPLKYHRACLAISEKSNISKDWACPTCKKNTRRGDNSQTPVKDICASPSALEEALGASGGEEDGRDLAQQLAQFMEEMREFRREMVLLRDSFVTRMDTIEQRLDKLEQRPPGAGSEGTADLERTIAELKRELNDRDQEALLSDLEIGQLPEDKGASTVQAVTVLAARLGVTLEPRDVVFAERVGAPPAEAGGRPRRVVVRLARRQLRDELLQAARVRRTGQQASAGPRVYINERLTRANRQLFHCVREECRRLQWRYSWTRRGRIFARQGDGRPVFQFRSDGDLARAFGPQIQLGPVQQ